MTHNVVEKGGLGPWHTENFDDLSWHDVHIHGFRLDKFSSEMGASDLVLDIDYILRWEKAGGQFLFTICQAELRFHQVVDLKFSLDYTTSSMGMGPFSLAGIEREQLDNSYGHPSFHWQMTINCPAGYLEFDAPRFTQMLVGTPIVQAEQLISAEKRAISKI